MRYWDASALVPLVVSELHSEVARSFARQDPVVVTWAWSKVEIVSAIERHAREGELSRSDRRRVLDRVDALSGAWEEVTDILSVRARAVPLLARHALRAADAAQLGAALLLRDQLGTDVPFVCLDGRLSLAAEREGLAVLPAP